LANIKRVRGTVADFVSQKKRKERKKPPTQVVGVKPKGGGERRRDGAEGAEGGRSVAKTYCWTGEPRCENKSGVVSKIGKERGRKKTSGGGGSPQGSQKPKKMKVPRMEEWAEREGG